MTIYSKTSTSTLKQKSVFLWKSNKDSIHKSGCGGEVLNRVQKERELRDVAAAPQTPIGGGGAQANFGGPS